MTTSRRARRTDLQVCPFRITPRLRLLTRTRHSSLHGSVSLCLPLLALLFASSSLPAAAQEPIEQGTQAVRLPAALGARPEPRPTLPSEVHRAIYVDRRSKVVLPPVDVDALLAEDALAAKGGQRKVRIGVPRETNLSTATHGRWVPLGDSGRAWTLAITATGALGLRLHFRDFALPAGARLFVYVPGSARHPDVFEHTGPDRNGDFWSNDLFGETVVLELHDPDRNEQSAPRQSLFAIPEISHHYKDPFEKAATSPKAAFCERDATCEPAYASVGDAVGRYTFADNGTFLCSGTLLNNNSGDFSPLFLTANHCISRDSVANSMNVYWFFETATCNGAPPNINDPLVVPRSTGARFLNGRSFEELSDVTLLQIQGALPPGLTYAGWTATNPPLNDPVTGIHHPLGEFRRISFGSLRKRPAERNYHSVVWSLGTTEGGSSGSALLNSSQQVIGQLFGGLASCANPSGIDLYGRLSRSFPYLTNQLNGRHYLVEGLGDDFYEENDSRMAAAPLGLSPSGASSILQLRAGDEDWFRIVAPANAFLTVTANYTHANGDMDFEVYEGASPTPVASATGSNNLSFSPSTAPAMREFFLRAFMIAGVRNEYRLTVSLFASSTETLTILATHPGATVTLTPADLNGETGGNTPIVRQYPFNTNITVNASPFANGQPFSRWTGCNSANGLTCSVSLINENIVTALYGAEPCRYSASPTGYNMSLNSSSFVVFRVDSTVACSWTASTPDSWITIPATLPTFSDGVTFFDIAANPGPARWGTINLAGHTVHVTQRAATGMAIPNETFATAQTVTLVNNAFLHASTISGGVGLDTTNDPSPPCGNNSRAQSLWYTYTAPASGAVTASTLGSGYDTILSVWTGAPPAAGFTNVACNDDSAGTFQSQVSFQASAGVSYHIMVSQFSGSSTSTSAFLIFTFEMSPPRRSPVVH